MAIFAGLFPGFLVITPWLFNIAMEPGPFLDDKHDDFPMKNSDFPVRMPQTVQRTISGTMARTNALKICTQGTACKGRPCGSPGGLPL